MNNTDNTAIQTEELGSIFEDKQLAIFFSEWLKNGQNATKAYLKLHQNVSRESAMVLGSRQLRKVKISDFLALYDLGLDTYLKKLKEGLDATIFINSKKVPDHKTRFAYLEILGKILKIEDKVNEKQENNFNFRNMQEAIGASRKERGLSP